MNVIVPVGLVPPASGALMEVLAIATPVVAVAGAATVVVVAFLTTVDVMPVPQMLLDAMLLASPLKSISAGLVPVHLPAMKTGRGAPFVDVVVRAGVFWGVVCAGAFVSVTPLVRTTVLVAPPQPAAASAAATANKLVIAGRFIVRMVGRPQALRPGDQPRVCPRPALRRF